MARRAQESRKKPVAEVVFMPWTLVHMLSQGSAEGVGDLESLVSLKMISGDFSGTRVPKHTKPWARSLGEYP